LSKEAFRILKEINSHLQKVQSLAKTSADEQKRIDLIEKQRSLREDQLKDDSSRLNEISTQMTQIDEDLKKVDQRIAELTPQLNNPAYYDHLTQIEAELQQANGKKEEHENVLFELMELSEELEEQITDSQTFLEGSLESLNEIKEEILQENGDALKEANSLNKRVNALFEEVPTSFKQYFERAQKKHGSGQLFTFVKNNSCEMCGLHLDQSTLLNIENKHLPHNCKVCSRLFIPTDIQQ
jgi:predicted  nucleic acid-binding Zn-ribbon protein